MSIVYNGIIECKDIMLLLAFKKACKIKRCQAIDENLYYIEIDSENEVYRTTFQDWKNFDLLAYFEQWLRHHSDFLRFDKEITNFHVLGLDRFGIFNQQDGNVYVTSSMASWAGELQSFQVAFYNLIQYGLYYKFYDKLTVAMYKFWEELADGINE
jgi:hypothetical protein